MLQPRANLLIWPPCRLSRQAGQEIGKEGSQGFRSLLTKKRKSEDDLRLWTVELNEEWTWMSSTTARKWKTLVCLTTKCRVWRTGFRMKDRSGQVQFPIDMGSITTNSITMWWGTSSTCATSRRYVALSDDEDRLVLMQIQFGPTPSRIEIRTLTYEALDECIDDAQSTDGFSTCPRPIRGNNVGETDHCGDNGSYAQ